MAALNPVRMRRWTLPVLSDTQNIVLLGGVSEFESYWNDRFREEVHLHYENLNLIEFVGLPPRTALYRVSRLPHAPSCLFKSPRRTRPIWSLKFLT